LAILWCLPISIPFSGVSSIENEPGGPGNISLAVAAGTTVTIAINPKFYALNPCEKRQFSATVTDADGQEIKDAKVTWQSSSPEVAKIDEKGVAVALKPGATMIKPIVSNGKGDPASLFVRDKGVAPNC
jgi:hypothetical protein